MAKIFINGKQLNVGIIKPILVSYAIDQIGFTKGNKTNVITIPYTYDNIQKFGLVASPGGEIKINNKIETEARIEDGVSVVTGKVQLLSANKKEISFRVYSGNTYWKNIITGKSVLELDYSDEDHIYNLGNIKSRWNFSTDEQTIIYPLVNYGEFSNNAGAEVAVEDMYPAFRIRNIFLDIFKNQGYKVVSEFIDSEIFKKYIIIFTNALEFNNGEFISDLQFIANKSNDSNYISSGDTTTDNVLIFDNDIENEQNYYNPITGTYTTPSSIKQKIETTLQIKEFKQVGIFWAGLLSAGNSLTKGFAFVPGLNSKYKIGESVELSNSIYSVYNGASGTIIYIRLNVQNITLPGGGVTNSDVIHTDITYNGDDRLSVAKIDKVKKYDITILENIFNGETYFEIPKADSEYLKVGHNISFFSNSDYNALTAETIIPFTKYASSQTITSKTSSGNNYRFDMALSYNGDELGTIYTNDILPIHTIDINKNSTPILSESDGTIDFDYTELVVGSDYDNYVLNDEININYNILNNTDSYLVYQVKKESEFKNVVSPLISKNQTVTVNSYLPDIDQLEFIKAIRHLFNLKFTTNNNTRRIYIEPKTEFNKNKVIDLTNRIDISKEPEIEYYGEEFNKVIRYKYKNDDNDSTYEDYLKINGVPRTYKDAEIENIFAKDGISPFENEIFADTFIDSAVEIGLTSTKIPKLWKETPETGAPDKETDFEYRILKFEGEASSNNWVFDSVIQGTFPKTSNLNFTELFEYYSKDIETYNEAIEIELNIYLDVNIITALENPTESVEGVDFRNIFYFRINNTGGYYELVEIKNLNTNKIGSTKCIFRKLAGTDKIVDTVIQNPDIPTIETIQYNEGLDILINDLGDKLLLK